MRVPMTVAAALLSASAAFAQTPAPFPPGAEAREVQLMARVGPQTRAWIAEEAHKQSGQAEISEQAVTADIRGSTAVLGNLSNADIEALMFIVMMEAAKSAREDLRSITDGVKAINDAKAKAQPRQTLPNAQQARIAAAGANRESASTFAPQANTKYASVKFARADVTPKPLPKAEFDARLAAARSSLDNVSEMGEIESLRLQMAMDRHSKMMQMLSNLLKKMADTADGIVQNLK